VTLASQKQALRQAMRVRRRQIAPPQAAADALKAAAHLAFALTRQALPSSPLPTIALYWPQGSELDPRPLCPLLGPAGYPLALPVVVAAAAPLAFRCHRPGETLVEGAFGIPVPPPRAATLVPDLILLPLLAFDRSGGRLGQGGGFYDRTLVTLRAVRRVIAVGYGYAWQEVAQVPREATDQPLDAVVTEQGWRDLQCG
jgi:5-formyltetrahydrofolate cyclo-ligase